MQKLWELVEQGGSPFHVVMRCKEQLSEVGFQELKLTEEWELKKCGQYYVSPYPSVLFAFTTGDGTCIAPRIGVAHTDQPALRIKPDPEMIVENYKKVNVEKYGGLIANTWLDRPLAVAGKVVLKSSNIFRPVARYFDSEESVMTIPNLAIHMNRNVNQGVELNPQIDLIPLCGLLTKDLNKEHFFLRYLAEQLEVKPEEILDYDLYCYNCEKPAYVGFDKELFTAPRIDNLASVQALVSAIINGEREQGFHMIGLFDNEEIGSRSKQGADSSLMAMVLEKAMASFNIHRAGYLKRVADGFLLSVDGAHAIHPNHPEKNDPTCKTKLGGGVVIKVSGSQRYVTDSEAAAVVIQLCHAGDIPYQRQINRSDLTGGQTLGPIASSYLPMRAADLGIPMLAMHSARELAAVKDYEALKELLTSFFQLF